MSNYKKRGFLLENFRLFHLRSAQGTQVDYHYHEFCKILLLLSGSGGYYIDGQRYLLQPGDIVLLGSRSIHRPELDSGSPYERIIIYISPEYLQRSSTESCNLLSVFSGEKGHVLRLQENQRRKIFRLAASLEEDLAREDFGREILSSAGLLRLLVEIGRTVRQGDVCGPSPAMPKNERIREIIHHIDRHLTEDIDIDELAQTFFISKFHMMRLFRQETGTTIHLYITQKRLLMARSLIDGGMRATEACYRCGFRSYSSFTRACAKHFGTTPTGRTDGQYAEDAEME
jgi:AraC-like DNA-binding protein/mannose-6-phosphate isomerase-like protein (cupin superfamily)